MTPPDLQPSKTHVAESGKSDPAETNPAMAARAEERARSGEPPIAAAADMAADYAAGRHLRDVDASTDLRTRLRLLRHFGLAAAFALIGGFGFWAATAPLAGGAVAEGEVQPEGDRRVVQHLEGGVIREIFVREGQAVDAGEPLLQVENLKAKAKAAALMGRRASLLLERERRLGELALIRGDHPQGIAAFIVAGDAASALEELELRTAPLAEARLRETFDRQHELIKSRENSRRMRAATIDERVRGYQERILGAKSRVNSLEERIVLLDEELAAKRILAEKALIAPLRLLEIERRRSELVGARDGGLADIGQVSRQISESRLELQAHESSLAEEHEERLAAIEEELIDVSERLATEQDIIDRATVRAPTAGRVFNLAYKTEGGVVSPGAEILQIVPMDEQLIVTAKISVVDVDIVETGQTARVRFSAFPARTVPEVEGEVLAISAYRKMDEASGKVHYEVRVGADLGALTQMEPPLTVVPGMPAEVLIVTETRTLLDYLLEPIESAIRRGMRET